jgi:hypothetical protein
MLTQAAKRDQFVSDVGLTYSIVSAVANVLRLLLIAFFRVSLASAATSTALIVAEVPMLFRQDISVSDLHRP